MVNGRYNNKEGDTMNVRDAILEAAMIEFGDHGYQGCSTNAIVARSGVSKGSIFHNYKNKEGLYEQCCITVLEGVAQALASSLALKPPHAQNYYFEIRQQYLRDNKAQERLFYRLLWEDVSNMSEAVKEAMRDLKQMNIAYLKGFLDGKQVKHGLTVLEVMNAVDELQAMIAVKFFNKDSISEQDVVAYNNYSIKMINYLLEGMSEVKI